MKVSKSKSKYFNGYNGSRTTNISLGESVDVKESLGWRYSPKYDPDQKTWMQFQKKSNLGFEAKTSYGKKYLICLDSRRRCPRTGLLV